jgi:glycerol dehydrogenase-like iron-containing ADH family enzyme
MQLVLEGRTPDEIREVMAFCAAVGLPLTLQALGISSLSPDQAQAVAMRAVAPVESAHNEPFAVEWRAVQDAILAADAMGQDFLAQGGHPPIAWRAGKIGQA